MMAGPRTSSGSPTYSVESFEVHWKWYVHFRLRNPTQDLKVVSSEGLTLQGSNASGRPLCVGHFEGQ